jgi:nitrite reductase/ring-hydroxylating ferredoxin subunit
MTPQRTGLSRDELRPGFATLVDVAGSKVLLIRIGEDVRAVSAWCTHMRTLMGEQPVAEDGLVECPLHGAVFDSADGSQQLGPTCDALPVYEVEIAADGAVSVAVTPDTAPDAGAVTATRASSFGAWGSAAS